MTATVQDLKARMLAVAARRAADVDAKHAKLVIRAAKGEPMEPEGVMQTLAALDRDLNQFQDDLEHTARRFELRAVADQLADRAKRTAEAQRAVTAFEAEYAAAFEAFQTEWGAKEDAVRGRLGQAEASEREAAAARGALESGCRDQALLTRIRELEQEKNAIPGQIAKSREAIAAAAAVEEEFRKRADPARFRDERDPAASRLSQEWESLDRPTPDDRPPGTKEANARNVQAHRERIDALTARVAAIDAELAALRPRVFEPWPVGIGPRE
jgi:hypothetical protein